MKNLLPNVWEWSWFSEEKQLNFNGHVLRVGEHTVIVDPPLMTSPDIAQIRQLGEVDYMVITNRDHERETQTYQNTFGCRVFVPEKDAPEMKITANKPYADGELLPGGIWAVHLADQKSPGECALFIQQGKGILIVGDALIGKPVGSLSLLPAEKYVDVTKAREGLKRLLKYNFDTILVGDGTSIVTGAKQVVEQTLQ